MIIKFAFSAILLVLFSSCKFQQKEPEKEYQFFDPPKTYPLNTTGGYKVNPVSGDSIKPIINSLGDTVKTGVSIPAIGKVIDPGSAQKPKVVRAGIPNVIPANTNVHVIPESVSIVELNVKGLKKIKLGDGDTSFVLVNSSGDTVPTGIPIPVTGREISNLQPQLMPALPLRMKETPTCNIQYLDVEQGMSNPEIRSILQDKRGSLWFGTVGSGVSRYTGRNFTHYTEKDGFINDYVWCIIEDKSGNLWIGTQGGVTFYNGISFTNYTEREGLPNNDILSVLEDKNGNLWFASWGGGVTRFDGKNFTNYTVKEGLPSNLVSSILEDKNGNLWFGTWGGGASRFDGSYFINYTKKEGLTSNQVWCITEDNGGDLWFGFGDDGNGVTRFDGTRFTNYTEKEGLINNNVSAILEDKSGDLWFTTFRGGVSRFDGISFTNYAEQQGTYGRRMESILEDNSGNILFGMGAHGISIYGKTPSLQYIRIGAKRSYGVFGLLEDKSGNLWLGTDNDGVIRYDGTSYTYYTETEGLRNNAVFSMLEDKSRNLWFGNGGGLLRFNGTSFTNYTENEGLVNNNISCMREDRSGNIWIGTWDGGVSRYDGTVFTNYTEKEGLPSNKILCIQVDHNGNIWIGTWDGGVSRFDGTSFIQYTEKEGLSNNDVGSILEDKDGNLWFGTWGGGVSRFNGASFTHYTEREGLSNNYVGSILEDRDGNLWINTDNGVNYFAIERPNNEQIQNTNQNEQDPYHVKIYVFGRQDGIKEMSHDNKGAIIDNRNRAWWNNWRGLTMLDLNQVTIPTEPPLIYLSQLDINETFIDYRLLEDSSDVDIQFSAVSPFENYPLNLKLPYRKNHLTFYYYGIDWASPYKIKYMYQLEGLKNEWSAPTEDIKADFRNLSYGDYTFKVKAIGMAQVWSKPLEYKITIMPPWWRSRLAYGFYLLSFIAGSHITYSNFRKRLLQKERERNYEKELKQRASELEMQALRAQMNPHFIFNSLNSINNFILKNDKSQASDYLIKFSKLIRLILENSTYSLISLEQELEALKLYIELEALRFQHRFNYQVVFSKDLDITSIKVPPLILQPFVENAIHHGLMPKEGPGQLKITIIEMEGHLVLKIEDNGIGRYQSGLIRARASQNHKSLGLNVTSERIAFLNNQHAESIGIEINDLTDERGKALGTEVCITIPVII